MKNNKWLMPSYFKNFKCKCEKCRHTCCKGWKIRVSQNEYFKLIGMECSHDLHYRIDGSFSIPKNISEDCYRYISFNWLGNCPMQKDGLCMLHSEKGEEYLPKICRLYPRSLKQVGNQLIACCTSSCEAVIESIYDDGFKIVTDELEDEPEIVVNIDKQESNKLFKYYEILKENKSLTDLIKDVCLIVNESLFLQEYNIDTNPLNAAMNLLNRFSGSDNLLDDIIVLINKRYQNNSNQFEADRTSFEKEYPNWMEFFKNVINNSLTFEAFPFVDQRFDITNAFKGLCAAYGLLRLVCIGYTSVNKGKDALIDAVAELFHLIEHTSFYYNVNIICENAAILLKL